MIITKIEDYYQIYEDLESINESTWVSKAWTWATRSIKLKKYNKQLDNIIGPEILDKAIDEKTGELNKKLVDVKVLADPKSNISNVFSTIKRNVKTGKYFLSSLKKIEDYIIKEDNQYLMSVTNKVASGEKDPFGTIDEQNPDILKKRYDEFSSTFNKFFKHIEDVAQRDVSKLISELQKEKSNKVKLFEDIVKLRFSNAKTVILALQYEIYKKRWKLDDIQQLETDMVDTFKKSVKFKKELALYSDQMMNKVDLENEENVKQYIKDNFKENQTVDIKSKTGKLIPVEIVEFKNNGVYITYTKGNKGPEYKLISYNDFRKYAKPTHASYNI